MKKFYVLSALLLMAVVANAQSLRLQLFDKNNSETIPFAYVHLLSQTGTIQNTVQTDNNGIAILMPDEYPMTVEINALGFESIKKQYYAAPVNTNISLYLTKKHSTLDEVVITGVTKPQNRRDASAIYKVITRDQIQAQGAVSLDEVMRNQLNVTIGNDPMLGTNLGMQGLGSDKVKILIDGLPVNGREGGSVNLGQMLLHNVDRIEIVQGPMSVVYGADALGGVINIITKTEKKPYSLNVGGQFETVGRINFDASASKRIGKRHQVTLGGARNQFLGWGPVQGVSEYNEQYFFLARSYTFKPNEQYMGNLSYNYTAPSGFNVKVASDYLSEKVTNKGNLRVWDPFTGAIADDEYYYTKRSMNRLSLGGKLGQKGTWQNQNGYLIYNRIRNSYITDMTSVTPTLDTRDGMQDTSKFTDIYSRASYNNNVGNRFEYTVGYDINLQYAFSMKIDEKNKQIQDYALYTNMAYQLVKDKLKLNAGFRGAYNTVYKPPILPNITLLFTPVKKVQIRASYTEGYRAPTLKELYLNFIDLNHDIRGNENLKPESSKHVQLSASYQVYEEKGDYLQFILSGFYNNVYNLISLGQIDPNNLVKFTYANLYHRENTIGTFETDGQFQNLHYQVGFTGSYTFEEKGQYPSFSSTEANLTLQYTWKKPGIGFNTFYKLTGKRPFLQSNIDGTATYNGTQAAFHMIDLSVEKRFMDRKLQVVAGVRNLLDFQRANISGGSGGGGGAHGGTGGTTAGFMPRSFFTSLRLSIN